MHQSFKEHPSPRISWSFQKEVAMAIASAWSFMNQTFLTPEPVLAKEAPQLLSASHGGRGYCFIPNVLGYSATAQFRKFFL